MTDWNTDHFGLHTREDNNGRETIESNILRFVENHFDSQIKMLIWPMKYVGAYLDMMDAFANLWLRVDCTILDETKWDISDFIGKMNLDEIEIDLYQIVTRLFVAISNNSPSNSVSLDYMDSLDGPWIITFKDYWETFERGELLANEAYKDWIERKCMTALFEIRYAHIQRGSKNKIGKLNVPKLD